MSVQNHYLPANSIQELQEAKLQEQLLFVAKNSPFYSRLFAAHGIDVSTIKILQDLQKLPTTSKNDIQTYNDDFFCVPQHEIRDYATTSGTLGSPVTFGLTDTDLDRLAFNEMTSFQIAGVQPGDVVQLMTTIDRRFMAGLAYFLGLRELKCGVIRIGSGIPQMQWDSIFKYKPKFLIGVPSFLLKMIDFAEKNNIPYQESSVQAVVCIGEALRTADLQPTILAQKIAEKWNVKLHSTYASTEMGAAFTECDHFMGGHVIPELIITEILDENDQVVPDGESGELVVTTLGVQGIPLVRFKTGDVVRKHAEVCKCGRTTYRIGPVEGRKQQMVKYKGTTLYPPAMHDALAYFDNIEHHVIEIWHNELGTDEIVIKIAFKADAEADVDAIKDHFRAKLRVTPKVEVATAEALQKIIFNPLSRKPIVLIDKRA
ncbi:AMP-binding protein [Flavobacterium agricola]|uniref:AMP-binding protein n=1 Tax=Flavobacterium agricola TaxID=2870839 RepID=A0ABY6M279_9FLAO|nr:AMP-binding protein [Flavobacterium agricola]UYW00983.1 AMP-binding protein [Flavobacterium agricola]